MRKGICSRIAVKPSTRKSMAAVTASKNPAALSCSQVMPILTQRPSGSLGSVNQLSTRLPPITSQIARLLCGAAPSRGDAKGRVRLEAEALLDRLESGLAVEGRHAI